MGLKYSPAHKSAELVFTLPKRRSPHHGQLLRFSTAGAAATAFHAPPCLQPQVETKTVRAPATCRPRLRSRAAFLPRVEHARGRHARRIGAAAVRGRLVFLFFHTRRSARRRAEPAGQGSAEYSVDGSCLLISVLRSGGAGDEQEC